MSLMSLLDYNSYCPGHVSLNSQKGSILTYYIEHKILFFFVIY